MSRYSRDRDGGFSLSLSLRPYRCFFSCLVSVVKQGKMHSTIDNDSVVYVVVVIDRTKPTKEQKLKYYECYYIDATLFWY